MVAGGKDAGVDVLAFRRQLMAWYALHARVLPWRGIHDPYCTWVSEVMLQQTRVAAVIDHYHRFLKRFPTVKALAKAEEEEVLTAWSGLGYYRRARMMHRAARHVVAELRGKFPETAAELRVLPGIGEYTSAAIASIAFGERVAVLDGNVERVLLRVAGRPEEITAASRKLLRMEAAALVPASGLKGSGGNPPGDHNQAMMELGATVCLPRAPLCLQCPVFSLCRTRGEHTTVRRNKALSRSAAYLLDVRRRGARDAVLLHQRPADLSIMAGMYELPLLAEDAVFGVAPKLRLRHAITNTVYAVEIFEAGALCKTGLPVRRSAMKWFPVADLGNLPLTGLARKVFRKIGLVAAT